MVKKISLLLFLMLMTACISRGLEGDRCLKDGSCRNTDLACDQYTNKCVVCGVYGGPCCADDSCNADYDCRQGRCEYCGQAGGSCCPGNICNNGSDICGSDQICHNDCGSYNVVSNNSGGWDIVDQPCCPGNICAENNFCDIDGLCKRCGMDGQIPCPGGQCEDKESTVIIDGKCRDCGRPDQPCCSGNICKTGNTICAADQICQTCGASHYDISAGVDVNEPCCTGNTCADFYTCSSDNTCKRCGFLGGAPCPDDWCGGWVTPFEGVCSVPFKIDPKADVSICSSAEPGNEGTHQNDWCYWYAAYYKNDTSLCSSIEWGEMLDKCQAGENPENYYEMSTMY